MKKADFYKLLEESLEIDNVTITSETVFTDLEDWDSMSLMILIAFADEHFNKKLTTQDLKGVISVSSLIDKVGAENFED